MSPGTPHPPVGITAPEAGEAIAVTIEVSERGYRAVLLAVATSRLRFVLPLMAFGAFASLATGFNTTSCMLFAGLFGVVGFVWLYVSWASGSPGVIDLYRPVAYEFSPERIVYAGSAGSGQISWETVSRWRIVADHYLLFVRGGSFLMVPIQDVARDDRARFEALLRAAIVRRSRGRAR